jgi:hypothetical protein
MKKLSKNKLGLRKEAVRVLHDTLLENAHGGVPNSGTACSSSCSQGNCSYTPCTKPIASFVGC